MELFFKRYSQLSSLCKRSRNIRSRRYYNMRKALINHEGARIAKDGEDWNETRMTNVEGFSVLFQDG